MGSVTQEMFINIDVNVDVNVDINVDVNKDVNKDVGVCGTVLYLITSSKKTPSFSFFTSPKTLCVRI